MTTKKAPAGILAVAMILGLTLSAEAALPYVFHETFDAPPLTAGTAVNDWDDGWNNGDNGWEISEGDALHYYFSQAPGGGFTGSVGTVGKLRTIGSAGSAGAIKWLPSGDNYTSGNVTFKVTNRASWGWGSDTRFFLIGKTGPNPNDVNYATEISFGNPTGTDDRIYVSQTWGGSTVVADASTLTTDGQPLKWNYVNDTTITYATVSIDFTLTTITVTVSTTDTAGVTHSASPVSFPVAASGHIGYAKAGLWLRQSPTSQQGLVWMDDFTITAVPETVVFHETFAAPPLTAGTEGNDWTDGWNNGDNGWEISEGPANVANSYFFSQRPGGAFTGAPANIGVLRTDGYYASGGGAIKWLPTDQSYSSGTVTFKVQNMIGSWGSDNRFFLIGKTGPNPEDVNYATEIRFGNPTGTDDRIYVDQTWGVDPNNLTVVADASTLTTDGQPLQWNTAGFNPNAGNYATVSVDFTLTTITVTVSTTNAAGVTRSALPVSFPVAASGHTGYAKAGFWLRQSPTNNGLVWMSDFKITSKPEIPALIMSVPQAALTIDGDLSDWPTSAQWSDSFILWNGDGLSSTTKAKFAWNDAQDLLYVAVQTNEASLQLGGHLVIGSTTDKASDPRTGIRATQLCFDTQSGNDVLIQNEIQVYKDDLGLPNPPWAGGGTDGVQAKYMNAGGIYTYEIAIPLWMNWLEMTTKQPLSVDALAYVYVVMEDAIGTDNGMNLSYLFDGNPLHAANFYMGASATNGNAWTRAAALTLLAPTTADLAAVLAAMDTKNGQGGYTVAADMDVDGEVTSSDLAIVLADLP